jgi:hypothetical protein
MDKQLSPETEDGLKALAREISIAHDLDREIQEELFGHMEDKALGYLSGEEPVSQADVVLLTREHFGNVRNLKDFLGRVHQVEATVSLARRLAAVTAASLGVAAATGAIRILLAGALAWHIPYYQWSLNAMVLNIFGPMIAGMFVLFMILRHWQRKLGRSEGVWFQTYTPSRLFAIMLGMLFLNWCVPVVQANVIGTWTYPSADIIQARVLAHNWLLTVLVFIPPLIWVWWSDRRPRRAQAILLSIAAYYGFQAVTGLRTLVAIPCLVIDDYSGINLTLIHHPTFGGTSERSMATVMDFFLRNSYSTSIALGGALILYGVFLLAQRGYARSLRDS